MITKEEIKKVFGIILAILATSYLEEPLKNFTSQLIPIPGIWIGILLLIGAMWLFDITKLF